MKKLTILSLIAIAMLVMSCSDSESVKATQGGKVTVKFNVLNYQQISLDDEVDTRSTAVSNLKYLMLGIYDAETLELIDEPVKQEDGVTANFGQFTVELEYGNYKVLVLGYVDSYQADITDPRAVQFDDKYVPNTFCSTMDLTVDGSTSGTNSIVLSRVVAAFRIVFADRDKADTDLIDHMYGVYEGGSHILNSFTGYADEVVTRERKINSVNPSYLNICTFLTEETATMNFTVSSCDKDDNIIVSHKFTNVPMRINQLTVYTGNFYSMETDEEGFTVQLADDYEWVNIDEHSFNFSDF